MFAFLTQPHPLILFCQFLKAKYPLLLKSFIKGEHEETCMDYNSLSVPLKTFTSGVGRIARVAIPSKPRKTRCWYVFARSYTRCLQQPLLSWNLQVDSLYFITDTTVQINKLVPFFISFMLISSFYNSLPLALVMSSGAKNISRILALHKPILKVPSCKTRWQTSTSKCHSVCRCAFTL